MFVLGQKSQCFSQVELVWALAAGYVQYVQNDVKILHNAIAIHQDLSSGIFNRAVETQLCVSCVSGQHFYDNCITQLFSSNCSYG